MYKKNIGPLEICRNRKLFEVLRSGEYNQIVGHLKTASGHCLEGVMCEEAGIPLTLYRKGYYYLDNSTKCFQSIIPKCGLEYFGMDSNEIRFEGLERTLWQLNDDKTLTFPQFADLLEAELERHMVENNIPSPPRESCPDKELVSV